jgi:SAM-dependent methyltransferase
MSKDNAQKPLALEAYNTLAKSYAARVDTKPHNAYYERPATSSLLPDVKGKRVLDAGCGPGVYAEWLVTHGAEVVAIDVSEEMVRYAKERLGAKAQVIQADLGQPLNFLAGTSFDLVLSALALDYVRNWDVVFSEFFRVLRPGGHLIFSVSHPFVDFFILHPEGSYFETEAVSNEWTGFDIPVTVPTHRRPLSSVINPLLDAGFTLERLLEPIPTEQFKQNLPQDYADLVRRPGFLCVRAVKRV